MSNQNNTLKARLLRGTRHSEPVYVPELESDSCGGYHPDETLNEDCDGVVQVRALTDAEMSEVDAAELEGQIVRTQVGRQAEQGDREQEVSVSGSSVGQARARRIAAAYGLCVGGDRWSPSDVGQLPPPAVRRIATVVRALSGGDGLDDARAFRRHERRGDDGGAAPDGDAAGGHAG